MERTVKVMNYLQVVGSIAHMCNGEYKAFFEHYEKTEEEDRETFVFDAVDRGEIVDVKIITEETVEFLNLPENQTWFISKWNNEYVSA